MPSAMKIQDALEKSVSAKRAALTKNGPGTEDWPRLPDGRRIPPFGPTEFVVVRQPMKLPNGQDGVLFDDGADDDWEDIMGDRDFYDGYYGLEYCVASVFAARAIKAYRAGWTFGDFLKAEMAIDSEAAAKREQDPRKKALMLNDALENALRIGVLQQLKHRLFNEVWEGNFTSRLARNDSKSTEVKTDDTK